MQNLNSVITLKALRLEINMSGFITSFLNFTVGILCDKIRDVTAGRLSEGDLTDEKFRKLIVRELDDIKCRLEGLARKDLLSSFSFFKEGICRLNLCLQDKYTNNSRVSDVEPGNDAGESEDATFSSKRDSFLDSALTLSNIIRELKIDSKERLLDAKKSFRTSREEATRAFNNVALTIDDRIMASKLRIASRILEGLQDPDAAAQDCLLYIEELHNMPAVREIFSVHVKGGMKSRLNQAKRLEKSRSITTLNFTLLEFISKFTKTSVGCFNWPVIDLRGHTFHPIFDDNENLVTVEKSGLKATWETTFSERLTIEGYHSCAVNSKGQIFITDGKWNRLASIKVVKRSGEIQLFSENVLEEKQLMYSVSSLTIDANDDIYLGICCLDTSANGIRVLVFNSTGSIKRELKLPIDEYFAIDFSMMITQESIITCSSGGRLHFFDSKDSKLKAYYSLPHYDSSVECSCLSTSDENDIIVNYPRGESVNIYTEGGELKQIIKLPRKDNTKELVHTVRGVVFDPVRKHVLVLIYDPFLFDQTSYRLLVYSKSSELLNTFRLANFPVEGLAQLTSHPTGPIAVIGSRKAIFLHI
jgi:hypothetical protein